MKNFFIYSLSSLSLLLSSSSHAQTSQPWVRCAVENGTCQLPAAADVRFGSSGAFALIYNQTGSVGCNKTVFGPSMFPSGNYCEYQLKSAPVVTRPVYPGCAKPGTSFLRTITLDGYQGQTLQKYFASGNAKAGDRIIVKGPQGDFGLFSGTAKNISAEFASPVNWTWIDSQGATFKSFAIYGLSKFIISKPVVSDFPTPDYHHLVKFIGSKDILLEEAQIYAQKDSSKFTVSDWLNIASGISSDNSSCISLYKNKLSNLRHGIRLFTRASESAQTSIKNLAQENELRNISGDFINPNGSDIILQGNKGYDAYVSIADGDGNHDDFIQGFAYPLGIVYSNLQVIGNYFQETTNPTRAFNSRTQGISVFDGFYNNFQIRGNTILAGGYHGISMYGATNGLIENNTVLGTAGTHMWISAFKSKFGEQPENIIIRNNVTNVVLIHSDVTGATYSNNYEIKVSDAAANFTLFDVIRAVYDVKPRSTSILYGKKVGSVY